MNKPDPIPARLAALKNTPTPDLKQQWRDLFDSEPPPFNRRYLESRLAYRIQELAYGGLKPETIRQLERLGEELDGGDKKKRGSHSGRDRPIAGTRLLREWQGVEQVVTVTAERIRDKVAASRKKGMWMGGVPPYGYRVENRKLMVDEEHAEHVRWIFARFLEIGSCTELARDVGARGIRTPRGNRIDKKYIYRMLSNRAYIGEAVHKGESYPGEHDAIIDPEIWDRVHAILQESPRKRAARTRADTPALLKGLLFGPDGAAFSPTHTRKGDRLYRYYVSQTVLKHGAGSCPVSRVPAGEIEGAVIDQLRAVFRQPEIVAGTWKAARAESDEITEADARAALQQLDPLWNELFPAEQARIVTLLVERVDIGEGGLNVRLRMDGLGGLAREMLSGSIGEAA